MHAAPLQRTIKAKYQQLYFFLSCLPRKLQEEDKIQHMKWSLGLFVGAYLIMSTALAFSLVMCIGLLKEFWDSRFGSGFCYFDMTGNLVGCFAGIILTSALNAF